MDNAKFRILLIDSDRAFSAVALEALRRDSYRVEVAIDLRSALEWCCTSTFDLVVAELAPPDSYGIRLMEEWKNRCASTQFIILAANGTVEGAVTAMRAGAFDYVPKPLDVQRLRFLVARALQSRRVADGADPSASCEIRPGMTISECEKLLIRQTLTHATTNREQAARLLGISRRTLQYKLKSYGLLTPRREPPAPPLLNTGTN